MHRQASRQYDNITFNAFLASNVHLLAQNYEVSLVAENAGIFAAEDEDWLAPIEDDNAKRSSFSRRETREFESHSPMKEVILINIGEAVKERILELCRERDITINKLSNMSGVTQSTVNNIVSGRNNSTTISTIKKLCDGLGITIEDFFHSELFRGLEQEIK